MFASLCGRTCHEKHVPDVLMRASNHQVEVLLSGYFDGDGYTRKRQQSWCTVSNELAIQVNILVAQLGYCPSLRWRDNGPSWVGMYTDGGKASNPALSRVTDDYVMHPVRRVETSKAKSGTSSPEVFDLQVEEDESFVVGQAVVHNCRIGQTRGVLITHLVANHVLEKRVYEALAQKSDVFEGSVDASSVAG